MAKRRFRIEGSSYGGELVVGETNPGFANFYSNKDESEIIDAVLDADQWSSYENDEPEDALLDPNAPPGPGLDNEPYNMWENDELEHVNGSYVDGGFTVYEVPADGSDDWDYEKEVYEGEGICLYSREGAYFGNEEPEEDSEKEDYIPVLAFHSSEKGTFGVWFLDTDDDFDEFKLGYGFVETNIAEIIERVYYDKVELEINYDYNDTTGKSYYADVGWLNKKWRDPYDNFEEIDQEYWDDFEESAQYERENR